MLQSVLSVANEDQSAVYPPSIFSSQFRTVTSLLISKLVQQYPGNPTVLDILMPFIKFSMQPVKKGVFALPDDYRNILGAPYIFVNGAKQCGEVPEIKTAQQFLTAQLKGGCNVAPIVIVSESEFSERTRSTYKKPSHSNPIGYFAGLNETGQKVIKICPYDLTVVGLLYARQEGLYQYGYFLNPDDTFSFDASTTVESEWTSAGFQPIFTAMMALYSAYVRDNELRDWSLILSEKGIL